MGKLRLQWLIGEAIVPMSGHAESKILLVSGISGVPLTFPIIP